MKPSQQCIDLIKSFEGLSLKAYRDPGSVDGKPITIGWGTTNYLNAGVAKYGRSGVMLGDTLTEAEAEQELLANVARFAKVINASTNKLNQNQFDAAVSFVYNTGAHTRQITRLQSGAIAEFRRMLLQYNKGGDGRVMPGLVRRRKAEADLWDSGSVAPDAPANWINLVRHGSKTKPDLRAYLMSGDSCVQLKSFASTQELISILQRSGAPVVSIGEYGWHMEPLPPSNEPVKYGTATLTRTGRKEERGCEELLLTVGDQEFIVRSGQPWAQVFQKGGPENRPGSMMPLPGGLYSVSDIEWAGGKDNYNASWGEGLGGIWVGLTPRFSTKRSGFGAHIDAGVYGTAGCVGLRSLDDLKRFVAALRKFDPKSLDVLW